MTLTNSERIDALKAYNEAHKEERKKTKTAREVYHDLEMSCPSSVCLNVARESLTEILDSLPVEQQEKIKKLSIQIEKESNKLRNSLDLINKLLIAE